MGTEFWIQNAVTRAIRFRTLPSLAVCLILTSVHYSPFTEELGQRNSKLDLLKIYDTMLLGKYHVTNHQVYHAMRMMLTIVFSKIYTRCYHESSLRDYMGNKRKNVRCRNLFVVSITEHLLRVLPKKICYGSGCTRCLPIPRYGGRFSISAPVHCIFLRKTLSLCAPPHTKTPMSSRMGIDNAILSELHLYRMQHLQDPSSQMSVSRMMRHALIPPI